MKNLIKKILKEEIKSVETFTIQEINVSYLFENFLFENNHTVFVSSSETNEKNVDAQKNYFPYNKDGFWCPNNYMVGNRCEYGFEINLTKHWIARLSRSKEKDYKPGGKNYDPKIKDPDFKDCLNMVHNGIDVIIDFIRNAKNWSGSEEKCLIVSKSTSDSYIEQVIKLKKKSKNLYVLNFISNIGGVRMRSTDYNAKDDVICYRKNL
jgi:hypothetical protein